MALTVQELIDHVLFQCQLDSAYRTRGLSWLNIVRDKLAARTDYKFYRKTASNVSFISGQNEYDLPTDFKHSDSCFVVDVYGKQGDQIWLLEPYRFEPYAQGGVGVPRLAMVDERRSKLVFDTLPPSGVSQSYRLNYFIKPTPYTIADYASTPDFSDQDVLIQEMMLIGFEAQDDERYGTKYQEKNEANKQHQRNMLQSEGTGQLDLAQTHFKPRRRR